MCLVFMSLCLVSQVQLSIRSSRLTIYEDLGQVTAWNFPVAPAWQAIHFTDCEAFRVKCFTNIFPKGNKWPTAVCQESDGMVLNKTLLIYQASSYKEAKWPSPVPKIEMESPSYSGSLQKPNFLSQSIPLLPTPFLYLLLIMLCMVFVEKISPVLGVRIVWKPPWQTIN